MTELIDPATAHPVPAPADLPAGREEVGGKIYMKNAQGGLDPEEKVKPTDHLQDLLVRTIVARALPLSVQIAEFKQGSFDDVDGYIELLAQQYGTKPRGKKGNLTLTSYDGLQKVNIAVADNVVFGPELQIAKQLFDEVVREEAGSSSDFIRAIVTRAFNTDKDGLVNRAELLSITRVEHDDPRWNRAVQAIRESQRVIGSRRYVRVFTRPSLDAGWTPVTLDVAGAK
ncbi:DUF3164 family protein [Brevundimonas sp.]|uniref:DUF3164 family protein n=1 Tax=Brevundimonas sp. TaxID=1871086 RepID=UPI003F706C07